MRGLRALQRALDDVIAQEQAHQTALEVQFLLWRLRLPKRFKRRYPQESLMDIFDRDRRQRWR